MLKLVGQFLPSLVPGLSALTNPWVWAMLAALATASFTAGWTVESWRWDAAENATLENNLKVLADFWRRQTVANAETARRLARDRAQLERERTAFDEELANADENSLVEVACPKPQPAGGAETRIAIEIPARQPSSEDGPRVRLSAGACRLFNIGLAVGLPEAYRGWGADAAAGCAGPVEVSEVIRNAERNAELANGFRSRLIAWQVKACREGWWSGPECGGPLLRGAP